MDEEQRNYQEQGWDEGYREEETDPGGEEEEEIVLFPQKNRYLALAVFFLLCIGACLAYAVNDDDSDAVETYLMGIFFLLGAGCFLYYIHLWAEERRAAFIRVAERLGLEFHEKDPSDILQHHDHLDIFERGEGGREVQETVLGNYEGYDVSIFTFRYQTYHTDWDSDASILSSSKRTKNHYCCVALLKLGKEFPELRLSPETTLDKIIQGLGWEDIDLDNLEFSNRYMVKSESKKFAYDIFHPRMMEFVLEQGSLTFSIQRDILEMHWPSLLDPEEVEGRLDYITAVRDQFPNYIFTVERAPQEEKEEEEDIPPCSTCGQELDWIEDYQARYCWSGEEYA